MVSTGYAVADGAGGQGLSRDGGYMAAGYVVSCQIRRSCRIRRSYTGITDIYGEDVVAAGGSTNFSVERSVLEVRGQLHHGERCGGLVCERVNVCVCECMCECV